MRMLIKGLLWLLTANVAMNVAATEYVILLHGLCRSSKSMEPMARFLRASGYQVLNLDYPSRTLSIHELAEQYLGPAITRCAQTDATAIHFVTHSMGGILVRDYLAHHEVPKLGRVVMLGPPNQGSEVVDCLCRTPPFRWLNGPAGQELGTGSDALPNRLGPVKFPLGIIAGDRSINWINSLFMIHGPDDGKVSVVRTRVEGMADHWVIHATHPLLMRKRAVMRQVLAFLQVGKFVY